MSVISIPGIIRNGQIEKYADGDRWTGTVAAGQAATGGLLLDGAAGDRVVQTAGVGGSVVCVGLAIHDAAAAAKVTVASQGIWMAIASGAVASGSRVVADTTHAGQVKQAAATPDARTIVGRVISDATDQNLVPTLLR